MPAYKLHPLLARWLRAETGQPDLDRAPDWDLWLLQRMSRDEVVQVGDVLVDRAVLRQRFACVSDRCVPRPGRGGARSCCADVFVPLSCAEDRRLAKRGTELLDWLEPREPRLGQCRGRGFFRAQGQPGLARPGRRCVFSHIDGKGRIRCHLHAYARQMGCDRGELQPLSCRLFPLIVVDRGGGRAVLTVLARHTHRLVGAYPASRYPCLDDRALPPLHESMRDDLDWVFGRGFAEALAALGSWAKNSRLRRRGGDSGGGRHRPNVG